MMVPHFLIIGAQRCGTSSLYENIIQHPNVISASTKEVHFFDIKYAKGFSWYETNFKEYEEKKSKDEFFITGEATPYYLFHPLVPQRIAKVLPKVKLIVLLRNPVNRAYSHYNHEVRLNAEKLSFEDAIKAEEERLSGEEKKMLENENYYSFNHQHFSYLKRGIYVDQIKKWHKFFDREQFLIINSEEFFSEPNKILTKIFDFLDLPAINQINSKISNKGNYPPMKDQTREKLANYFKIHNERLSSYLDWNFGW